MGGAAFSYGSQVVGNIIQGGLNVQAFTEINWGSVAGGAVAGAVGAATMGIGTAIMGTSLGATVATQAVSGVVEGQISRAVENVVNGNEWYEGLGNVGNMASDAAFSAFTAAVSWKPKASANLGLADGTGGAKASGAHTVYTVKNDAGEVIYVGRSSNLAARQSAHRGTLGRENWVLNPEVKGLSYKEARYHEQRLISKYGGVDALENKINGVAPAKWGALCKEFE